MRAPQARGGWGTGGRPRSPGAWGDGGQGNEEDDGVVRRDPRARLVVRRQELSGVDGPNDGASEQSETFDREADDSDRSAILRRRAVVPLDGEEIRHRLHRSQYGSELTTDGDVLHADPLREHGPWNGQVRHCHPRSG